MTAVGAAKADAANAAIEQLVEQQQRARAEKHRLSQEIKNERRKRTRLAKQARLLTTQELLQVVAMRERGTVAAHLETQPAPCCDDSQELVDADRREQEEPIPNLTRSDSPE